MTGGIVRPVTETSTVIEDPPAIDEQTTDEPSGDLATLAKGTGTVAAADQWDGPLLDFRGDKLQILTPTAQGLAGFSLSQTKFIPTAVRNNLIGLFIYQHLSLESYVRVFGRLMDPTDNEYDVEVISDLMTAVVETYDPTADDTVKKA